MLAYNQILCVTILGQQLLSIKWEGALMLTHEVPENENFNTVHLCSVHAHNMHIM